MGEDRVLIDYLKTSIDRLADKFELFLQLQAERDLKHHELEHRVQDHTTRIVNLETPSQKKLQERYPIVYKLCETVILIGLTVMVMKLSPAVGKILTGTLG